MRTFVIENPIDMCRLIRMENEVALKQTFNVNIGNVMAHKETNQREALSTVGKHSVPHVALDAERHVFEIADVHFDVVFCLSDLRAKIVPLFCDTLCIYPAPSSSSFGDVVVEASIRHS